MGSLFSPAHLIVIIFLLIILFGRGRMSEFMEDLAKGIKNFKKGLEEENALEENQKPTKKKPVPQKKLPIKKTSEKAKVLARKENLKKKNAQKLNGSLKEKKENLETTVEKNSIQKTRKKNEKKPIKIKLPSKDL